MGAKIVRLTNENATNDPFPNKLTFEELRRIWNNEHCFYTDDELMRLREWMYALAEIILRLMKEKESEEDINFIDHLKQAS